MRRKAKILLLDSFIYRPLTDEDTDLQKTLKKAFWKTFHMHCLFWKLSLSFSAAGQQPSGSWAFFWTGRRQNCLRLESWVYFQRVIWKLHFSKHWRGLRKSEQRSRTSLVSFRNIHKKGSVVVFPDLKLLSTVVKVSSAVWWERSLLLFSPI